MVLAYALRAYGELGAAIPAGYAGAIHAGVAASRPIFHLCQEGACLRKQTGVFHAFELVSLKEDPFFIHATA